MRPKQATIQRADAKAAKALQVTKAQLEELLDVLDTQAGSTYHPNRQYARQAFRKSLVLLQVHDGKQGPKLFPVACRNISRSGLSILSTRTVPLNTRCTVTIPVSNGQFLQFTGEAIRSRQVSDNVHELGIELDDLIDMSEMVDLRFYTDWYTLESVDPASLTGNVLYVDDASLHRKLLAHQLRDTKLTIDYVHTATDVLGMDLTKYHLLLIDFHLPEMDGGDLIAKLRTRGIGTPALVLTADTTAPVLYKLCTPPSEAQGLIPKPLDSNLLHRAIAEFILIRPTLPPSPAACTLSPVDPNYPLATEFTNELHTKANQLREAFNRNDLSQVSRILGSICSTADPLGYARINMAAQALLESINSATSVTELNEPLNELISNCSKAHLPQAA